MLRYSSVYESEIGLECFKLSMNYAACYCEENVWHLCADPALPETEKRVVWVSSDRQICPLWCQRSAAAVDEPVWWDYHVFLLARGTGNQWQVWDFDTTLGMPVASGEYFSKTFRQPMPVQPVFRVMDSAYYRDAFASDRSHMKSADGSWLAEPPVWPPIISKEFSKELSFADMLNMRSHKHGELKSLDEVVIFFD